jgi:hypothetical protein
VFEVVHCVEVEDSNNGAFLAEEFNLRESSVACQPVIHGVAISKGLFQLFRESCFCTDRLLDRGFVLFALCSLAEHL